MSIVEKTMMMMTMTMKKGVGYASKCQSRDPQRARYSKKKKMRFLSASVRCLCCIIAVIVAL